MKLIFRKVDEKNPKDIQDFNELMDDLSKHTENTELLMEKMAAFNRREDVYLMVAEDAETGKLCGSMFALVFDDLCDDCLPIMVIENVVTHHDYQRKGVGRQMFAAMEAWGKEKHIHYAMLCSGLNRVEAHQFYRSIGYEEIKGYKKYM